MNPKILHLKELLHNETVQQKSYSAISSGCLPLDQHLPQRGFQRGSLVEWIGSAAGSGAGLLAMLSARSACQSGGALVVVDRERTLFPPAVRACGLDLQDAIIVHPTNDKDECWAMEQALRCSDVAAMVAWPRRLASKAFRRLQLAAEQSGCLGLLIRPASARNESSWASVRLLVPPHINKGVRNLLRESHTGSSLKTVPDTFVETGGWRLEIKLLRCNGFLETNRVEIEIDEQTGDICDTHPRPLAAQLANPTPASCQARA